MANILHMLWICEHFGILFSIPCMLSIQPKIKYTIKYLSVLNWKKAGKNRSHSILLKWKSVSDLLSTFKNRTFIHLICVCVLKFEYLHHAIKRIIWQRAKNAAIITLGHRWYDYYRRKYNFMWLWYINVLDWAEWINHDGQNQIGEIHHQITRPCGSCTWCTFSLFLERVPLRGSLDWQLFVQHW